MSPPRPKRITDPLSYQQCLRERLVHVCMRSEVNSNRFEISNRFEKLFRLHGNFTAGKLEVSKRFQNFFRLHGVFTVANFPNYNKTLLHLSKPYLLIDANLIDAMQIWRYWLLFQQQ